MGNVSSVEWAGGAAIIAVAIAVAYIFQWSWLTILAIIIGLLIIGIAVYLATRPATQLPPTPTAPTPPKPSSPIPSPYPQKLSDTLTVAGAAAVAVSRTGFTLAVSTATELSLYARGFGQWQLITTYTHNLNTPIYLATSDSRVVVAGASGLLVLSLHLDSLTVEYSTSLSGIVAVSTDYTLTTVAAVTRTIVGFNNICTLYIYQLSTTWSLTYTSPQYLANYIQPAVAVAGDGKTVTFSQATGTSSVTVENTIIQVLTKVNSNWVNSSSITADTTDATYKFGQALTLNYTGSRLATCDTKGGHSQGFIFDLSGTTWSRTILADSLAPLDANTATMVLNSTGDVVALATDTSQAIAIYKLDTGQWSEVITLTAPNLTNTFSMSSTGLLVAVTTTGSIITFSP